MASTPVLPYLPPEIVNKGILPRLPVRALARFKCVSKSWLNYISTQEFIEEQLKTSCAENRDGFLLFYDKAKKHVLSCELDKPETTRIKFPFPLSEIQVSIVGECRGWVCFHLKTTKRSVIFLINAALHSCKAISAPKLPKKNFEASFGFGFDTIHGMFKVVRIGAMTVDNSDLRTVHVFEIGLDKIGWTLVEELQLIEEDPLGYTQPGILINNSKLHWLLSKWSLDDEVGAKNCVIRSFDVCEHIWREIATPYGCGSIVSIGALRHSLCLVVQNSENSLQPIDIWLMSEDMEEGVWIRLFSVDSSVFKLVTSWNTLGHAFPIPITYSQNGKRILMRHCHDSSNSLYWFDPISQSIEEAEIGCIHSASELCYGIRSLIPMAGSKRYAF